MDAEYCAKVALDHLEMVEPGPSVAWQNKTQPTLVVMVEEEMLMWTCTEAVLAKGDTSPWMRVVKTAAEQVWGNAPFRIRFETNPLLPKSNAIRPDDMPWEAFEKVPLDELTPWMRIYQFVSRHVNY